MTTTKTTKNYKIINSDMETAEVVFPKIDSSSNEFWVKYEEFNQNIAPFSIEIDYDTKSYTKVIFDYSLSTIVDEDIETINKTLVEHCDQLVKFFKLTKKEAVIIKQWEQESCVSRYKHAKESLSLSTESLSEYMKKGLNGLQKEEVRIKKNQKFPRKNYWTLETYNNYLQKVIDEVKEKTIEVQNIRFEYNMLKTAA